MQIQESHANSLNPNAPTIQDRVNEEITIDSATRDGVSDGIIFHEKNSSTGLFEHLYTAKDSGRISFNIAANSNPLEAFNLLSGRVQIISNMDLFNMSFFGEMVRSQFSVLGKNNNIAPEDKSTIMQAGIGLEKTFYLVQEIFNDNQLFESCDAHLTYVQMKNAEYDKIFKGKGFSIDYSFNRRVSINQHIGLKLSYNLASLKNDLNQDLVISWMGVGLDYSIYF